VNLERIRGRARYFYGTAYYKLSELRRKAEVLPRQVKAVASFAFDQVRKKSRLGARTNLPVQDLRLSQQINDMLLGKISPKKKMKGFRAVVSYTDGTEEILASKDGFSYVAVENKDDVLQVTLTSPECPTA
jgi:hypothetical protein